MKFMGRKLKLKFFLIILFSIVFETSIEPRFIVSPFWYLPRLLYTCSILFVSAGPVNTCTDHLSEKPLKQIIKAKEINLTVHLKL